MKSLIVDDRQLAASALAETLAAVDPCGTQAIVLSADAAFEHLERDGADVVFLDIEMPGTDGFACARRIAETQPFTNVVFVTGHPEHALEAHSYFASGFLLKPATEADVARVLNNLRHPVVDGAYGLHVQCFGNFEVFHNGRPLAFERTKTKELFAYLVDRQGAQVSVGEVAAVLWEDASGNASKPAQLRNLIHDLRQTLADIGQEDLLLRRRGSLALDCTRLDCDYTRYRAGDPAAREAFHGEYMSQYSWAETTAGLLQRLQ